MENSNKTCFILKQKVKWTIVELNAVNTRAAELKFSKMLMAVGDASDCERR